VRRRLSFLPACTEDALSGRHCLASLPRHHLQSGTSTYAHGRLAPRRQFVARDWSSMFRGRATLWRRAASGVFRHMRRGWTTTLHAGRPGCQSGLASTRQLPCSPPTRTTPLHSDSSPLDTDAKKEEGFNGPDWHVGVARSRTGRPVDLSK
jgi:hypothetical protein